MQTTSKLRADVIRNGFAVLEGVLSVAAVDELLSNLKQISQATSIRSRDGIFLSGTS